MGLTYGGWAKCFSVLKHLVPGVKLLTGEGVGGVKFPTQKSLLCLILAILWGDTDNIERQNKADGLTGTAHLVGITMGQDAR